MPAEVMSAGAVGAINRLQQYRELRQGPLTVSGAFIKSTDQAKIGTVSSQTFDVVHFVVGHFVAGMYLCLNIALRVVCLSESTDR